MGRGPQGAWGPSRLSTASQAVSLPSGGHYTAQLHQHSDTVPRWEVSSLGNPFSAKNVRPRSPCLFWNWTGELWVAEPPGQPPVGPHVGLVALATSRGCCRGFSERPWLATRVGGASCRLSPPGSYRPAAATESRLGIAGPTGPPPRWTSRPHLKLWIWTSLHHLGFLPAWFARPRGVGPATWAPAHRRASAGAGSAACRRAAKLGVSWVLPQESACRCDRDAEVSGVQRLSQGSSLVRWCPEPLPPVLVGQTSCRVRSPMQGSVA